MLDVMKVNGSAAMSAGVTRSTLLFAMM